MITITPAEYIPFKRRVRSAFIGSLVMAIALSGVIIEGNMHTGTTPQKQEAMSPELKIQMAVFLSLAILFVCGIVVLSQAFILDSIVIDEKKKKMKILFRKFDEIVEKGEYDIDDNLKVKIITKHPGHGKTSQTMVIKYGKKRIITQNNTAFAGTPGWTNALYTKVKEETERIAQLNFPVYKLNS
jgi:hypothetical protein